MKKIFKILLYLLLISYSLMFWIIYLNIFIIGGNIIDYLKTIFTHLETLLIFPSIFLLIITLQPKN